jgi:galactose-1-phosphate uridylyltransferase
MKINYRIISVDEMQHSMVVRYWTDIVTEEMLAAEFEQNGKIRTTRYGYPIKCASDYNLMFYDKPMPTKEELEHFIIHSAPTTWLKHKEDVLDPSIKKDLSVVKEMLGKNNSFEANI